jgi:signal peptidase II
MVYYRDEITQRQPILRLAFAMIMGGAVGNLIDRALRGYVIDFLEFAFISFPVFNIADMGIVCGVALFIFDLVWDWVSSSAKSRER